jgi:hypothetical protein
MMAEARDRGAGNPPPGLASPGGVTPVPVQMPTTRVRVLTVKQPWAYAITELGKRADREPELAHHELAGRSADEQAGLILYISKLTVSRPRMRPSTQQSPIETWATALPCATYWALRPGLR